MKTYELVCVIDAGLASADISALKEKIEKLLSIQDTDDMGLLPVAYPLNGQDQAYFVSYCVEASNDDLGLLRTELSLTKGLVKFVFYTMKKNETFMKFASLQKRYDDMLTQEEERLNTEVEKPTEDGEEENNEEWGVRN